MKPDLGRLRDIHLPPAVSWWPPAPGWWVLAALLVAALGFGYLWYRHRRRTGWRRNALAELNLLRNSQGGELVRQLSTLLRRVAISRFPRDEVAALTGARWLAFLDRTLGDGTPFQSGVGAVLGSGPYARNVSIEATALLALCRRWIDRLPTRAAQ